MGQSTQTLRKYLCLNNSNLRQLSERGGERDKVNTAQLKDAIYLNKSS